MERETRFELATLALARRCSTTELLPLTAKLSIPGGRKRVKPLKLHPCGPLLVSRLAFVVIRSILDFDDFPIPHMQDATRDRRRLRIVRNHEGRLP